MGLTPELRTTHPWPLLTGLPGSTGIRLELTLKPAVVTIMEFEDVLFQHNSAVMMPERPVPIGTSSTQPGQASAAQDLRSGLEALAATFKYMKVNPDRSWLIAGHTDTSGDPLPNFKLSRLRARNVLHLLRGERNDWATIAESRHVIGDYQQILHWAGAALLVGDGLNETMITGSWNDATGKAAQSFFAAYDGRILDEDLLDQAAGTLGREPTDPEPKPLPPGLYDRLEGDPRKIWPFEAWCAFYHLYDRELARLLHGDPSALREGRQRFRRDIRSRQFVACGESWPIFRPELQNYRSQINRRVEVLFFESGFADLPPLGFCPPDQTTCHRTGDCVLWQREPFLLPRYLNPLDVNTVTYHLRFVYYNRILGKWSDVPEGLIIEAFDENDDRIMIRRVNYAGGLYELILEDGPRGGISFCFETKDRWIRTEPTGTRQIVRLTRENYLKLSVPDRMPYYDLPAKWLSTNYWTRDAFPGSGRRFQDALDARHLKPVGAQVTTAAEPLVFSLDDIVLFDSPTGGSQALRDADGFNVPKDLAPKSRVKIFQVDRASGKLGLYTPGVDAKSARIPFASSPKPINLITELVPDAKIVFFRNGFYPIVDRRTTEVVDWKPKGFVVGARAAILGDPDVQSRWPMKHRADEYGYTGDYELYYFHGLHAMGRSPVSYLIYFVSIYFMSDVRGAAKCPPAQCPTGADVLRFVDEGVYTAIDHWNRKDFRIEEKGGGAAGVILRPFWFFDERETFTIADADKPSADFETPDGRVDLTVLNTILTNAKVGAARTAALGGRPVFLAFVSRDDPPRKAGDPPTEYGRAYQAAVRSGTVPFSIFLLNKSAYRTDAGSAHQIFREVPVLEFGVWYGVATFAHELGHATGQPDEYVKETEWASTDPLDTTGPIRMATLDQYHVAYCMARNGTSMMYSNGAPRLRSLWYAIRSVEEEAMKAPLSAVLGGRKLQARLTAEGKEFTYRRDKNEIAGLKADPMLPLYEQGQFAFGPAPQRRISLALHYVGDDESSRGWFHAGQNGLLYEAVLVVRILIQVDFVDDGAHSWEAIEKKTRLEDLEAQLRTLEGKYRMVGGSTVIQKIFVNFQSGYSETLAASCNHVIRCLLETSSEAASLSQTGWTITWPYNISASALKKYLIHQGGATELQALSFLKTWVDSETGQSFTLERIPGV